MDGTQGRRGRAGRLAAGTAVAGVAVLAAACGGSTSSPTTTAPPATSTTAPTAAVVRTVSRGGLGPILVDATGRTLYRYTVDGPGTSNCTGGCATAWPPLVLPAGTTRPVGSTPAVTAHLGTTVRAGGALQVTYAGHPLYTYAGDSTPGAVTGQGVGGVWFVVAAPGASAAASTTTAPHASGY